MAPSSVSGSEIGSDHEDAEAADTMLNMLDKSHPVTDASDDESHSSEDDDKSMAKEEDDSVTSSDDGKDDDDNDDDDDKDDAKKDEHDDDDKDDDDQASDGDDNESLQGSESDAKDEESFKKVVDPDERAKLTVQPGEGLMTNKNGERRQVPKENTSGYPRTPMVGPPQLYAKVNPKKPMTEQTVKKFFPKGVDKSSFYFDYGLNAAGQDVRNPFVSLSIEGKPDKSDKNLGNPISHGAYMHLMRKFQAEGINVDKDTIFNKDDVDKQIAQHNNPDITDYNIDFDKSNFNIVHRDDDALTHTPKRPGRPALSEAEKQANLEKKKAAKKEKSEMKKAETQAARDVAKRKREADLAAAKTAKEQDKQARTEAKETERKEKEAAKELRRVAKEKKDAEKEVNRLARLATKERKEDEKRQREEKKHDKPAKTIKKKKSKDTHDLEKDKEKAATKPPPGKKQSSLATMMGIPNRKSQQYGDSKEDAPPTATTAATATTATTAETLDVPDAVVAPVDAFELPAKGVRHTVTFPTRNELELYLVKKLPAETKVFWFALNHADPA